jgi:2-C-methyl-D-erythritol 4-phosphate cytidylyltransferase
MSFVSAIIVAAGKGTRMGPNVDKLFLEVAGRPIIAHAWAIFDSCPDIHEIVLVIRAGMETEFDKLASAFGFTKLFRYAAGGAERQNSVWNGLDRLSVEAEYVAIQDGARPCTTHQIVRDTIEAARRIGAAVSAQKVTDTLKEAAEGNLIHRNVDRTKLWSVQTPQTFRVPVIRRALSEAFARGLLLTDDTAACELIAQPVELVPSGTPNPKATSPSDLPFIETVLRERRQGVAC